MLKPIAFCITSFIMSDPISAIILSCLAGVCFVNFQKIFKIKISDEKEKKNKKPKTIYTSEEEEIYLADNEEGPIWF